MKDSKLRSPSKAGSHCIRKRGQEADPATLLGQGHQIGAGAFDKRKLPTDDAWKTVNTPIPLSFSPLFLEVSIQ